MKKALSLFTIILIAIQFTSCGQTDTKTLSVDSFKQSIADTSVVLLDVRTPEEYAEGHIAGAINIDYKNPDFATRVDSLDKNRSYDLYCRSGHRSGESLKLMEEKGFTKVHHLEGGILKWQESGQPVVK
jgi:rhodanese-related sulfurtransferase